MELLVDPLPTGINSKDAPYPNGAHLTDLREVRDLLYMMQRPAIAPKVGTVRITYFVQNLINFTSSSILTIGTISCIKKRALSLTVPRRENDLVIFHNRGVHSVVGALTKDQVRVFHQCNFAGSDDPTGPSVEDVKKWA